MFLKVFQFARTFDPNVGKLQRVTQSVFIVNHISKRNAGHSEWANRKSSRESNANKKSLAITRIKVLLQRVILQEKNANPAVNTKLQAVLAEAKKASIPQSTLDKLIKPIAASLNRDNVISFTFSHSLGLNCVVDISSIQPAHAKSQVTSVMKKYGFVFERDPSQIYETIGIIYGKKSENVESAYDKAVEDALKTNCEEVVENDDGIFSFFCNPHNLEACVKSLTDLGYKVDYSEMQYQFQTYINIDDAIAARLEQIDEKLGNIPGFIKTTFNVE